MTNIAILSDITFDLIIKDLEKKYELPIAFYQFDSIIPTLMSQAQMLSDFDVVFVHSDAFFHQSDSDYLNELYLALLHFSQHLKGKLIVSNTLNAFPTTNLKNSIAKQSDLMLKANLDRLIESKNTYIFDFQDIIFNIGIKNAYHFKLGHLYQMPYTKLVLSVLSEKIASYIQFLQAQEKKVIVLDCDNTLWGGVVGEDGFDGIQINKNAKGILYLHFQLFIKQKMKEGFLLAICSKNNENDVKEVFDKKNMPLQWADFVSVRINWDTKVQNLKSIAEELNLGLESFIFIDDSDFEVQSVKEFLPQISTFQMTNIYDDFINLKEAFVFKKKRILAEDLKKSEDYKIEAQRKQLQTQVVDLEDYIKSLNIQATYFLNEKSHIERYAQMTEKTNQFNFNKEIFDVKALEQYIADGNLVYGLSVTDRFGDYGIIALILVDVQQDKANLRNYLMSCRALGRKIEFNFWNYVKQDIQNKGLIFNEIHFKKTEKNQPAQIFLQQINYV
jgi:FkbH-like protein